MIKLAIVHQGFFCKISYLLYNHEWPTLSYGTYKKMISNHILVIFHIIDVITINSPNNQETSEIRC